VVRAGRVHLSEQAPAGAPDAAPPVSLRATGAVCRALAATRTPIAYPDLVAELLATTPGATPEKVEELIDSLWQQTVLLTDLRPPLTTRNPARYVVQRLAGVPAAQNALTRLETLLEALESLGCAVVRGRVGLPGTGGTGPVGERSRVFRDNPSNR
jgi:lantibiotic biosynthesis protein